MEINLGFFDPNGPGFGSLFNREDYPALITVTNTWGYSSSTIITVEPGDFATTHANMGMRAHRRSIVKKPPNQENTSGFRRLNVRKPSPAKIDDIIPANEIDDYYNDRYNDDDSFSSTYVPSSSHPGSTIAIVGTHFGRNQGHVDILISGSIFPCEIINWSESSVNCRIPRSIGEVINNSYMDVLVWLKPARVLPPDPSTAPSGEKPHSSSGDEDQTYYYSGNEGPSKHFRIYQVFPHIRRLSLSRILPLQEMTISGSNFGDSRGRLRFRVMGNSSQDYQDYRIRVRIISWSDTEIRMQLLDTTEDSDRDVTEIFYSGSYNARIGVRNRFGNWGSAALYFVGRRAER